MYILSLHIREFGGLRDCAIDFSEGFNLITGDNESGKSTLIAFIRFIFYGLPKRVAGELLSDSDRAFSWSSGIADGSLTLSHGGRIYRIERREKEGSTKKLLQIIDTETGDVLPKGDTPESRFLAFPMSVFDSTCCIRQLRSTDISSDGLSGAIENLMLSGDESVNADRASDLLDKARKTLLYKNGKGGEIYKAKQEIAELSAALRQIREDEARLEDARKERDRIGTSARSASADLTRAEADARHCADLQILDRFDALKAERERVDLQKTAVSDLAEKLTRNGTMLTVDCIRTMEDTAEAIEADERTILSEEAALERTRREARIDDALVETAQEIRRLGGTETILSELRATTAKKKKAELLSRVLPTVGILILLAAGGVSLALTSPLWVLIGALPAAVLIVLGILRGVRAPKVDASHLLRPLGITETGGDPVLLFSERAERAFREAARASEASAAIRDGEESLKSRRDALALKKRAVQQQFSAWLPGDSVPSPVLLRRTVSALTASLSTYQRAKETLAILTGHLNTAAGALSAYDEAAIRASIPIGFDRTHGADFYRDRVTDAKNRLKAAEDARLDIERQISALEAVRRSPESVEAEIAEKTAACDLLCAKLRAVQLAESALEEARAGLKSRISPQLREGASAYLGKISGGKYADLSLDGEFAISARENGRFRVSDAFSGGTRDAMYLSLRLALSDMLSGAKDPLPVILDEALSQLDDTRAEALLGILNSRAEDGGQVLLFSCHTRERDMLAGSEVKVISLSE